MNLLRSGGGVIRVGHRGAAALAPENTLAALQAGIDHGVDAVEFDVLEHEGELVLAHSRHERPRERATLDDALELIARSPAGAHIDLKQRGLEARVAAALERHGLLARSLVSSLDGDALRELRRHDARIRVGLSYPEDRLGVAHHRAAAPAVAAGLAGLKRLLPQVIGRRLERCGAAAAVIHFALVTPSLVERCHRRGAAVWAWTVNDPDAAASLAACGADAIITDDPRILGRRSS